MHVLITSDQLHLGLGSDECGALQVTQSQLWEHGVEVLVLQF